MEEKNREEGKRGRRPTTFEGARVHGAAREKGGGRLGAVWGQEKERRGGPCIAVGSVERLVAGPGHRAWRRRCCAIEESGGARATLAREADRRDQATTGPGGQRLGVGGSERERGSTVRALTGGPAAQCRLAGF
jgi:hypothetical protein